MCTRTFGCAAIYLTLFDLLQNPNKTAAILSDNESQAIVFDNLLIATLLQELTTGVINVCVTSNTPDV